MSRLIDKDEIERRRRLRADAEARELSRERSEEQNEKAQDLRQSYGMRRRDAPRLDPAERSSYLEEGQPRAARDEEPDEQSGTPSQLSENAGDVPEETRGTAGAQGDPFRPEKKRD